jgi:hypothetical protein
MASNTEEQLCGLGTSMPVSPIRVIGTGGESLYTLKQTLSSVLAENQLGPEIIDLLLAKVEGLWNRECTKYESNHPEFHASGQRVLPMGEAMLVARRLVKIAVARVVREVSDLWVQNGYEGEIDSYLDYTDTVNYTWNSESRCYV